LETKGIKILPCVLHLLGFFMVYFNVDLFCSNVRTHQCCSGVILELALHSSGMLLRIHARHVLNVGVVEVTDTV